MSTTTHTPETVAALLARHGILTPGPDGSVYPSRTALAARLRDLDTARGSVSPRDEGAPGTLERHGVTVRGTSGHPGIRWGLVSDRLHELDARTGEDGGAPYVLRSRLPETSPCCAARLTRPLLLDRHVPEETGTWPCASCGRTYRLEPGTRDPRTGGRRLQAARVPGGGLR